MEDQVSLVFRGQLGYLFVETSNRTLQLPSCTLLKCEDFVSAAKRLLNEDLCLSGVVKGILKIQREYNDASVLRTTHSKLTVVFLVEESPHKPHLSDSTTNILHWLTEHEITKQLSTVFEASTMHIWKSISEKLKKKELVCSCDVLECVGGQNKKTEKRDTRLIEERPQLVRVKSLEDKMLFQSGYGREELKHIEEEFVRRCGSASSLMMFEQFSSLMIELGFIPDLCHQCFNALKVNPEAEGLTLREIQIGLCCLDPSTVHGGLSAQFRCQFIFYFYNSRRDYLYYSELRQMVKDICSFRKVFLEDKELERSAMDCWRAFSPDLTQGISLNLFLSVVGQLKFRGTSALFRLPHSPVYRLAQHPYSPLPINKEQKLNGNEEPMDTAHTEPLECCNSPSNAESSCGGMGDFDPSSSILEQEYTIATHFVKVKRSGTLTDVTTLWDLVGTEAVSGSLDSVLDTRPGFDRLPSINAFDKQSKSSEMLSGLRYFEHALKDNGRGKPKMAFSWGAVDMVSVAKCFIQLCTRAMDVFSSEPRLLDFSSPCYVLGDLHGNFHDLVCFEKVLWRMGPVLTPATFLFLGDYVDRGPHGFEVVAYVLAQKLLMPSKFLLVRGNHEIRAVQEAFTFKKECIDKFGLQIGTEVWEAANAAFDAMPVAAVIDNKVFCVHGGIPMPDLEGKGLISAINDIPTLLPDPLEQSPLAWEILWNDPIRQEEIDLDIEAQLQDNNGFISNAARGTAHMFSTAALEAFLSRNNLSHVIRAHECKSAGFQIQQHGHLLTVFSSSHYCGATNEAACVLVDNKKIRTIRLDTT